MRLSKLILTSIIFFFLTVSLSGAADVAKIGVVDFQKILATSNAGKKAQSEINTKGRAMESELKEKGSAIEKSKESLEREALVMSKQMRSEKERELRIMINDFKTLQKRYMQDFKLYEKRMVKKIRDDILALVEDLAKKEGYLLIIERREGGLLYFPNALNLTDQIIQKFNTQFGATEGKEN